MVLWWGGYELFTSWCPGEELSGRSQICPPIDPWKSLTLLALGLAAYFGTGTFVAAAFHDDDAQTVASPVAPRRHTLVLTLRCVVVLLGAIAHNTGVWVLVDSAFELRRRSRRGCYWRGTHEEWPCFVPSLLLTLLGYLLLLLSRSAAGNVGVYDLTPTPVLRGPPAAAAKAGENGGRRTLRSSSPRRRSPENWESTRGSSRAPSRPRRRRRRPTAAPRLTRPPWRRRRRRRRRLPRARDARSTGSIADAPGSSASTPNTGAGCERAAARRAHRRVEGRPGSRDSQV